jgi:hypothetical protein
MSDNKRKSNNKNAADGGQRKGQAKKGTGNNDIAAMSLSDVWAEQQGKLRDIEERFASLFDSFQELTIKQRNDERLLKLHQDWLKNLDPQMSKAPLALQNFSNKAAEIDEINNKKKEDDASNDNTNNNTNKN